MSSPRPIMVHGSVGGPSAWIGQEGAFAGAAAIALPGHPLGTAFAAPPEAISFVCDMARRVPAPRVLVGHELGAALVLEACLADPYLAAGAVVIACPPGAPAVADDDPETVVAAALRDTGGPAAALLRRELAATSPANRARTRALAAGLLDDADLEAIAVPVLAIAGGDDPVVPPARAETLAARLPRCQGAVIPDARHLVMADAPDAFNLLLAAFLARLDVDLSGA